MLHIHNIYLFWYTLYLATKNQTRGRVCLGGPGAWDTLTYSHFFWYWINVRINISRCGDPNNQSSLPSFLLWGNCPSQQRRNWRSLGLVSKMYIVTSTFPYWYIKSVFVKIIQPTVPNEWNNEWIVPYMYVCIRHFLSQLSSGFSFIQNLWMAVDQWGSACTKLLPQSYSFFVLVHKQSLVVDHRASEQSPPPPPCFFSCWHLVKWFTLHLFQTINPTQLFVTRVIHMQWLSCGS